MGGLPENFQALLARTRTYYRPVGPASVDCVQVIFIRDGSAFLIGETGQQAVAVGDVLLLGVNALYGAEPGGLFISPVHSRDPVAPRKSQKGRSGRVSVFCPHSNGSSAEIWG